MAKNSQAAGRITGPTQDLKCPEEPDLESMFEDTDNDGGYPSVAEYLVTWGSDRGDGPLFYNYGSDNHKPEYLSDLKEAIERLMRDKVLDRLSPPDLLALEAIHAYLEKRIAYAAAVGGLERTPTDAEIIEHDGHKITYAAIRGKMAADPDVQADEGRYYMHLKSQGDYGAVAKAVNQGIDARLQACMVPDRGDRNVGGEFWFSAESLPVLVRRLLEADDEEAEMFARDVLDSLGLPGD